MEIIESIQVFEQCSKKLVDLLDRIDNLSLHIPDSFFSHGSAKLWLDRIDELIQSCEEIRTAILPSLDFLYYEKEIAYQTCSLSGVVSETKPGKWFREVSQEKIREICQAIRLIKSQVTRNLDVLRNKEEQERIERNRREDYRTDTIVAQTIWRGQRAAAVAAAGGDTQIRSPSRQVVRGPDGRPLRVGRAG